MARNKPRGVDLTEEDRRRIAEAREVLQEYGLYVDVADMSDVAYERRNTRHHALELAVAYARTCANVTDDLMVKCAAKFERYIWEGEQDGNV